MDGFELGRLRTCLGMITTDNALRTVSGFDLTLLG